MFRVLFLVAFLSWPITSSTDTGARDPLTSAHDAAYANAGRISPLVQQRFALVATMSQCDYSDNQYAFNLALAKFAQSERYILHKAADAGWAEGAARPTIEASSCDVAIDRLRAADDALIEHAELLPSP